MNKHGRTFINSMREQIDIHKNLKSDRWRAMNDRPINEQESMAIELVLNRFKDKLIRDFAATPQEAEAEIKQLADDYDKKILLRSITETAKILGVPYYGFVFTSFVTLIVFIVTQDRSTILVVMPTLHVLTYIYYRIYHHICGEDYIRQKAINQIIQGKH